MKGPRLRHTMVTACLFFSILVVSKLAERRLVAVAGQSVVAAITTPQVQQATDTITRLTTAGDLRVRDVRADSVLAGRSHERYDQYYEGVPVIGGALLRQMEGTRPVSVFGQIYADIAIDATPTLTEDDAQEIARGAVDSPGGDLGHADLVVLPTGDGRYVLAYRVRVTTGTDRQIDFVDAHTGALVLSYSDLERQSAVGRGTGVFGEAQKVSAASMSGVFLAEDLLRPPSIATFDLHGNVGRILDFLNGTVTLGLGDLATSRDNTWTDGVDVDAHVYAGFTYDYYYKRFGRRGLDNHDLPITVIVHPASRANLTTASADVVGLFYLNAFYAGDGVVVYGEGLPPGFVLSGTRQTVDYFAGGLDIVAHELSHGVTEFTSGLIYLNESGALNEAFSDIMGLSAKFYFRPAGTALMQANYELGADVFRPGGIRSFDNPGLFGDPDHYSKRVTGAADNGGVHTNCTIVDHAFYLAIEGGTNRTSGLAVHGVGAANREQIEKAFYRGFTLMLPPNATFSLARAATIQAARDLYGSGSESDRAITQAWAAVGVP